MSNGSERIPERANRAIPDEVLRAMDAADHEVYARTNDDREAAMAGYRVIAEWARKEALRDAVDAVMARPFITLYMPRSVSDGEIDLQRPDGWYPSIGEAAAARIHALVGGDKTDD